MFRLPVWALRLLGVVTLALVAIDVAANGIGFLDVTSVIVGVGFLFRVAAD